MVMQEDLCEKDSKNVRATEGELSQDEMAPCRLGTKKRSELRLGVLSSEKCAKCCGQERCTLNTMTRAAFCLTLHVGCL
jgi:hypothetical protein